MGMIKLKSVLSFSNTSTTNRVGDVIIDPSRIRKIDVETMNYTDIGYVKYLRLVMFTGHGIFVPIEDDVLKLIGVIKHGDRYVSINNISSCNIQTDDNILLIGSHDHFSISRGMVVRVYDKGSVLEMPMFSLVDYIYNRDKLGVRPTNLKVAVGGNV